MQTKSLVPKPGQRTKNKTLRPIPEPVKGQNPKPETRNPKPETRNSQPATRNPKPKTVG